MGEKRYRLGIDIGATFTDPSALDLDTHAVHAHKAPSTQESPSRAVVRVAAA